VRRRIKIATDDAKSVRQKARGDSPAQQSQSDYGNRF
jgi:hypothetical protein